MAYTSYCDWELLAKYSEHALLLEIIRRLDIMAVDVTKLQATSDAVVAALKDQHDRLGAALEAQKAAAAAASNNPGTDEATQAAVDAVTNHLLGAMDALQPVVTNANSDSLANNGTLAGQPATGAPVGEPQPAGAPTVPGGAGGGTTPTAASPGAPVANSPSPPAPASTTATDPATSGGAKAGDPGWVPGSVDPVASSTTPASPTVAGGANGPGADVTPAPKPAAPTGQPGA